MNQKDKNTKPSWLTADREFYPHVKAIRDELKREMTPAEIILWEYLRNKKMGVKFRRQHVIGVYIPDFVSLPIKLIIEVDGKIHLKRLKEDKERTQNLEILGYKVIRFKNEEIENNIKGVLETIKMNIEKLKTK